MASRAAVSVLNGWSGERSAVSLPAGETWISAAWVALTRNVISASRRSVRILDELALTVEIGQGDLESSRSRQNRSEHMPVDDVLLDCEMHMEKAMEHLHHELR